MMFVIDWASFFAGAGWGVVGGVVLAAFGVRLILGRLEDR